MRRPHTLVVHTGSLAAICGLASSAVLANPVEVTKVALSGEPAPGLVDATFSGFSDPRINYSGLIAIWAGFEGPGYEEGANGGVFMLDAGPLAIRLLEGQQAPWRLSPASFVAVPSPALSDSGALALVGAVDQLDAPPGDEARNIGVFRQQPGLEPVAIAQKGQHAQGMPAEVLFRNFSTAAISRDGVIAFSASTWLDDMTDADLVGIWSDRSGDLDLLAATGDVLSAPLGDATLDHLDPPAIDALGGMVFRASLQAGTPEEPQYVLVEDASGLREAIVQSGQPAPGLGDEVFDVLARRPARNDASDLLFWARLAGADPESDGSLWIRRAGVLELYVREGQTAPGAAGATFERLSQTPALNARGEVAFWSTVRHASGAAAYGIWTDAFDGTLAPAAISGQQVFGLDAGTLFAQVEQPALDDRGQVLFLSRLQGPGVTPQNHRALFVRDTAGRLTVALREGDDVDVHGDGSDIRTLAEIIFEARDAAAGLGQINASRQALVQLRFADDSSGIFLLTIAAPADLNGDGVVDANDFFAFLDEFLAATPTGDFNQDGQHDVNDLFAFLDAFSAGD